MNTRGLFCFEALSLYLPNVLTRYDFGILKVTFSPFHFFTFKSLFALFFVFL